MQKNSSIPNKNGAPSSTINIALGERILDIRASLALSQRKFSENMGISPSYVSEIESGKRKPGYNFMKKIIKAFNVNINWLITGKGDMFIHNDSENQRPYDFGVHNEEFQKLLSLCEQSPLLKLSVLTQAETFIMQYEDIIKKDIKRNEKANSMNRKSGSLSLEIED